MTIVRSVVALFAIALIATPASAQFRQKGTNQTAPQQDAPPPKKEDKVFPLGKSWLAVSLNGKTFSSDKPAFTLDQQFRARGFAGCNTYSAVAYPLRSQGIAVGPFALTKRACPKDVMDAEHAFLVALRAAQKWDIVAGQLVIRGPAGELKFDRSI